MRVTKIIFQRRVHMFTILSHVKKKKKKTQK